MQINYLLPIYARNIQTFLIKLSRTNCLIYYLKKSVKNVGKLSIINTIEKVVQKKCTYMKNYVAHVFMNSIEFATAYIAKQSVRTKRLNKKNYLMRTGSFF